MNIVVLMCLKNRESFLLFRDFNARTGDENAKDTPLPDSIFPLEKDECDVEERLTFVCIRKKRQKTTVANGSESMGPSHKEVAVGCSEKLTKEFSFHAFPLKKREKRRKEKKKPENDSGKWQ